VTTSPKITCSDASIIFSIFKKVVHGAEAVLQQHRPASIDPELLIRMLIVGYCMDIRSERRLCEEIHLNLAYRWFCDLGLDGGVRDGCELNRCLRRQAAVSPRRPVADRRSGRRRRQGRSRISSKAGRCCLRLGQRGKAEVLSLRLIRSRSGLWPTGTCLLRLGE
jgi:hypothetical protein